jgi:hypothetical protein
LTTLSYAGSILVLIGGIIMIITGILYIIGSPFYALYSVLGALGLFGTGIVQFIVGIICAVGAKSAGGLTWAIVLLILGIIGGGFGGLLVILGALLRIISSLTHHSHL